MQWTATVQNTTGIAQRPSCTLCRKPLESAVSSYMNLNMYNLYKDYYY